MAREFGVANPSGYRFSSCHPEASRLLQRGEGSGAESSKLTHD